MTDHKQAVQDFYTKTTDSFDDSYNWEGPLYPSNRIRMEHTLDVLAQAKAHRVLDAGCGTGIILAELLKRGYDASGFDFTEAAVEAARARLATAGYDADRVVVGDIEDPPYVAGEAFDAFDAVVIMGAFTHPLDHAKSLVNLRRLTRPGGLIIVELRNRLFDLFTANDYSVELLAGMMPPFAGSAAATAELAQRAFRRVPVPADSAVQQEHEKFFAVPSVWRNPLTVAAEYRAAGWETVDTLWFHWHAAPPAFEALDPAAFRRESLALERVPHDWRGMFMASAFILVARAA